MKLHYDFFIGIFLGIIILDYCKLRINSWKNIKFSHDAKDKKKIKSMNRKSDLILSQFEQGLI